MQRVLLPNAPSREPGQTASNGRTSHLPSLIMPKKRFFRLFGKTEHEKAPVINASTPSLGILYQPPGSVATVTAPTSWPPMQFVNGATFAIDETTEQYHADRIIEMLAKAGYPPFGVINFQQGVESGIEELRKIQSILRPGQFTAFLLQADAHYAHFHSLVLARDFEGKPYALHFEDTPAGAIMLAESPELVEQLPGAVKFPARQRSPGDCLRYALDVPLHLYHAGYAESLVAIAQVAIERHWQDRSAHKTAIPYVQWAEMKLNPDLLMALQSFRGLREEAPDAAQWTIKYDRHAGQTLGDFWKRHENQFKQNGYLTLEMEQLQRIAELPKNQRTEALHALYGPPISRLGGQPTPSLMSTCQSTQAAILATTGSVTHGTASQSTPSTMIASPSTGITSSEQSEQTPPAKTMGPAAQNVSPRPPMPDGSAHLKSTLPKDYRLPMPSLAPLTGGARLLT